MTEPQRVQLPGMSRDEFAALVIEFVGMQLRLAAQISRYRAEGLSDEEIAAASHTTVGFVVSVGGPRQDRYAGLVDAATACVVGWPVGEAPEFVLALARGLLEAGMSGAALTAALGEGWEKR